jgi:hypothetical protein
MSQCESSANTFSCSIFMDDLPSCICSDPNSPNGYNCSPSRPRVPRQWPGHPYPGSSALFANSSTTTPSPFAFPQFPSQGYTNIQHTLFPADFSQTPYNNPHSPNPVSQTHYYCPPPNTIPPATQGVPSPSNRRKRKNNTTGRGGARKRQRQPASIVTAPTSAICGVGPSTSVPPTNSNRSDNDLPSSSPLLPVINVQPTSDSLPTTSASTRLPSASYSSLRANQRPQERSSAATDIWYFCRSSDSELKPASLPPPDQEAILKTKPRSPFVSCKLCKYASSFFTLQMQFLHIICVGNGKFIEIQMESRPQCETISNFGIMKSTKG